MREEMEGLTETRDAPPRATGGCLCGAVRYRVFGDLEEVVNCHCSQCRRGHGHFAAFTAAKRADLDITERRGLRWYASSDRARRAFCQHCGASLFWDGHGSGTMDIAAGSLDQPSGLKTVRDIYAADKADYYELAPGTEVLPQDE